MVCYSKAYWKRVSDRNRIRGKRSAAVMAERRVTRYIDADTMRQRALYDRRGRLYAEISVETEIGRVTFSARWSVRGRTDQVDLFDGAVLVFTCRPSLVLERIHAHVFAR
jgi:hypothetical protein